MFYAANLSGEKFIGKRVWADGDVTESNRFVLDKNEAFQYETEEAANAAAKVMFRKDAGAAVEATSEPAKKEVYIHGYATREIPGYIPGTRPSRHDIEEAIIHGEHELYS